MTKDNVIAIDGLSCVGKSTIARALAKLTEATYINTGYMYRAVGKLAIQNCIEESEKERLIDFVRSTKMEFVTVDGMSRLMVNGEDWTERLDDQAAIQYASQAAVIPEIRAILTEKQREYAKVGTIVMEGRDIGSVVFPHAMWKFYIVANFDIRIVRLHRMLPLEEQEKVRGKEKAFLDHLDQLDLNRKVAPLKKSEDTIEYDNSNCPTAEEDALVLFYYMRHPEKIVNQRFEYTSDVVHEAKRLVEEKETLEWKA